jgi:hypothetical protein
MNPFDTHFLLRKIFVCFYYKTQKDFESFMCATFGSVLGPGKFLLYWYLEVDLSPL